MILNLVVIAMIGLIAYLWSSQGLFSAFMHFLCVIVAGAVAFAMWEPLVYNLLINIKQPFQELAFGVGLMVPFLITLLVLRVACDKLVPRGMDFDEASNFVGGLVFGAASAFITVGIFVTSVSYFRLPPNFLGYTPVQYDAGGNLVKGSNLWVPADSMTVGLYEFVSQGSLATGAPLAVRSPDAHLRGALVRHTFDGKGRTSLSPADVDIVGRYTLKSADPADLSTDTFSTTTDGQSLRQDIKRLDGQPIGGSAHLEGFVLRLKAGAKERSGKFVLGRGQLQLLATTPDGEGVLLEPVAMVSQADATRLDLGRWRFDAPNIVISSVGGASEAHMAFEFVVPENWTPTDLLVRNVRFPISADGGGREFASAADRDEAVRSRSLFTELAIADPTLEKERPQTGQQQRQQRDITDPVRVEDRIGPAWTMNTTNRGGLQVENINKINYIVEGQHTVTRDQVQERGLDQNLRLERFAETPDTKIVQVDVSIRSPLSLLGKAADAAKQVLPPQIVDNLGQVYDAIGFVYDDGRNVTIRFTPGQPIRGLTELPTLSRSREDERLTLIFRPSAGVQIVSFNLGPEVIETLNPPIQLPRPRVR